MGEERERERERQKERERERERDRKRERESGVGGAEKTFNAASQNIYMNISVYIHECLFRGVFFKNTPSMFDTTEDIPFPPRHRNN